MRARDLFDKFRKSIPDSKKECVQSSARDGGKERRESRRDLEQAPYELADPLGSEARRHGLKRRAMNAALCMMQGKSSKRLKPLVIQEDKSSVGTIEREIGRYSEEVAQNQRENKSAATERENREFASSLLLPASGSESYGERQTKRSLGSESCEGGRRKRSEVRRSELSERSFASITSEDSGLDVPAKERWLSVDQFLSEDDNWLSLDYPNQQKSRRTDIFSGEYDDEIVLKSVFTSHLSGRFTDGYLGSDEERLFDMVDDERGILGLFYSDQIE